MSVGFPELHTLDATIAFHAQRSPEHLAIRDDAGGVTYAELDKRSTALAALLQQMGAADGARVAFLGREAAAYWELLFAAAKTGVVIVPINARLAPAEIEHIIADAGASVVLIDGDHPLRGRTGSREIVLDESYPSLRDRTDVTALPKISPTPDTPLAQLYTSGTTGLPKGVVLAHRSFFAIRDALASESLDWIDWQEGDVGLVGIPGFHVGGLWFAAQAFNAGMTVYSMPSFDAVRAREAIRSHGVTVAIFVPAMMRSILGEPGDAGDFTRLRKVIYGGAPIADALLQECTRVFDCDFAQIYGLTETGNTAICLPPDQHVIGSERLRAAGRPYPGVGIRIVGEDGEEVPQGYVGEVHLRSPAAMLGYWNLPEATAAALSEDGWVRTGDAGSVDVEGYLYIHDRLKDMILVAGENVYPAEIENALIRHDAVIDAAVIGIPDDVTGEAVCAYVSFHRGRIATTRELALFLRAGLADFKRPTRWEIVDEIPRNASGKILRRRLRESHWRGMERQVN